MFYSISICLGASTLLCLIVYKAFAVGMEEKLALRKEQIMKEINETQNLLLTPTRQLDTDIPVKLD